MSSKKEYQKLVLEALNHDRLYYIEARPQISDYEYDQLIKKIEKIEKEHPSWKLSSSPTGRVSGGISQGFSEVPHTVPMLSLANTYSEQELMDFIERVHKGLGRSSVHFCCELKVDGLAVSLRYENGVFSQGLTRGDGEKGEDVTRNLQAIGNLPLFLSGAPELLEVRAEVFMPKEVFFALNREREEEGEDLYANPRNAAAGSLKLLDPKISAKRKLNVLCYGIADESGKEVKSQYGCHSYLEKLGLPVFAPSFRKRCSSLQEITSFIQMVEKKRDSLGFEIDGIVIKVDEILYHDQLGATGKSPRWAVAYKFAPEQAVAKIEAITVQVGRTGVLTPVAELTPTLVSGSTISRATLHNQEEVERKDIRIGDFVLIEKGGDVIPKVVSVDKTKRPSSTKPWKMPTHCPSCGSGVIAIEGEVAVRCPNSNSCPEQRMRRLIYFASKPALDIEHLGEKVVEQLFAKKLVRTFSDFYTLDIQQLLILDGFKEKSATNLFQSLEASKTVSLSRLILALGIKYVGEGTADELAKAAGSLEHLASMQLEEILAISGVGKKIAQSVYSFFQERENQEEVARLLMLGVKPQAPRIVKRTDHLFYQKTFVLTGTLPTYTRAQATDLIEERGGKVTGSVSKKTDYLLMGADPGSKFDKAKECGVKILEESDFEKLL